MFSIPTIFSRPSKSQMQSLQDRANAAEMRLAEMKKTLDRIDLMQAKVEAIREILDSPELQRAIAGITKK